MRRCLILFFLGCLTSLTAQTELIVRWTDARAARPVPNAEARWLSRRLGIELLTFPDPGAADRAYKQLATHRQVVAFSFNRPVDPRRDPNDPNYGPEQENLRRAGFDRAWELTTGGTTSDGKEIVVAILDDGFDTSHPDLRGNLWENPAEIPGDFIDNDGNGLIDDRYGWNFNENRAGFTASFHGTQVAGILSARGNNANGGSGTNWDVKTMLFSIRTVADIIASYEYVLDQRTKYNDSNGRAGAFVVATNASFGVEGVNCDQFPVWRDLYDDLGAVGVLTAGSTANRSWDVDLNGDTPTTCPSDFLIGVTNVGPDDRLWRSAGFGRQNVDLAAPGEGSWTTLPSAAYGTFGSTSAAAPYVTGAIALLYATPLPAWTELMNNDPAGAARLARRVLLEGVNSQADLMNRTVTGGILDVAESQRLLAEALDSQLGTGFGIESLRPNPADVSVRIVTTSLVLGSAVEIVLTDRLGRRQPVSWQSDAPGSATVSVAHLPRGWYLVSVIDGERAAHSPLVVH